MDIQAISTTSSPSSASGPRRPQGPPPPPPRGAEDKAEFSPQAIAIQSGDLPDALQDVLEDLKGARKNLTEDLEALGVFFSSQPGGFRSLNAFMEAQFSREDLDAFREAAEAAGIAPPRGMED